MWYMRQKEEFGEDRSQGIRFYDNTQTCDYLPQWHMPYEDISSLVKMQLSDMSGWNITSYSVTGYGGTEECYSMPGQALWVMWPDYDTVNVAKDLIAQVMAGQTPVIPED